MSSIYSYNALTECLLNTIFCNVCDSVSVIDLKTNIDEGLSRTDVIDFIYNKALTEARTEQSVTPKDHNTNIVSLCNGLPQVGEGLRDGTSLIYNNFRVFEFDEEIKLF